MSSEAGTLLVLQHIGCEPAAVYEDELRERGLALERVVLDATARAAGLARLRRHRRDGRADGRRRRGRATRGSARRSG